MGRLIPVSRLSTFTMAILLHPNTVPKHIFTYMHKPSVTCAQAHKCHFWQSFMFIMWHNSKGKKNRNTDVPLMVVGLMIMTELFCISFLAHYISELAWFIFTAVQSGRTTEDVQSGLRGDPRIPSERDSAEVEFENPSFMSSLGLTTNCRNLSLPISFTDEVEFCCGIVEIRI